MNFSQINFTSSKFPEITTCPGQLKFAAITYPLKFSQVFSIVSSSKPKMAAIPPLLFSHAFCIALALIETIFNPSAKDIV